MAKRIYLESAPDRCRAWLRFVVFVRLRVWAARLSRDGSRGESGVFRQPVRGVRGRRWVRFVFFFRGLWHVLWRRLFGIGASRWVRFVVLFRRQSWGDLVRRGFGLWRRWWVRFVEFCGAMAAESERWVRFVEFCGAMASVELRWVRFVFFWGWLKNSFGILV